MDKESLKLRRHETFSIREGWIEKGLNSFSLFGAKAFSKESGTKTLGIGTNMVKALKYWMVGSNLITPSQNPALTEFGTLLLEYDPYMEDMFSWWMLHYYLVTNEIESPVLYYAFNRYKGKYIDKDTLKDEAVASFINRYPNCNEKLVAEDSQMVIRLYFDDSKDTNPEDNMSSPLSNLNLLEKDLSGSTYVKKQADFDSLHYLIVFYALTELYDDSFDISEAYEAEKSPCKVFNLSNGMFNQYIGLMKNNGLITLNKTAGLNTVYINKKLSLSELFEAYKKEGGYDL